MRVNVSFSKQITEVIVQPSQVVVCLNQLGNSEGRELGPVHIVIVDPLVAQGDHLDNPLKKSYIFSFHICSYVPRSQYFHPHDHSQAIVPDTRSPDKKQIKFAFKILK